MFCTSIIFKAEWGIHLKSLAATGNKFVTAWINRWVHMSVFVFSVIVLLLPLPPCHSAASKESRKCMGEMRCYRRQLCRDKSAAREEKLFLFSRSDDVVKTFIPVEKDRREDTPVTSSSPDMTGLENVLRVMSYVTQIVRWYNWQHCKERIIIWVFIVGAADIWQGPGQ